jgi:putative salt-induced outer membrane protein YdiY
MFRLRSPERFHLLIFWMAGWLSCIGLEACGENVTLKLSGGDRISGTVIIETTNAVVISNNWNAGISVPLQKILSRVTNNIPRQTRPDTPETLVFSPAEPKASTNKAIAAKVSGWKAEAQVGLDILYGASDYQTFYGRFKLSYQLPYKSNPKKFFRNGIDYTIDYSRTEGTTSSDRMHVSDKTAFDIGKKWYAYSLVGGGYDHVQRIGAQYEAGPGVGYHLLECTNFTMNVEAGLNYLSQYRDDSELQDVYYRLAEDITWKIWDRLSLLEKFEFFPRVNLTGHRLRFESTLKYDIWKNLSLNFTVLDMYDTQPADTVDKNELQIRSSVGIKF